MSTWGPDDLTRIDGVEELQISSCRQDGTFVDTGDAIADDLDTAGTLWLHPGQAG